MSSPRVLLALTLAVAYVGCVGWLAWSLAQWHGWVGALVALLGVLGLGHVCVSSGWLDLERKQLPGKLPNAYGSAELAEATESWSMRSRNSSLVEPSNFDD